MEIRWAEVGGVLSAIGGLGAAIATGFAARYAYRTWRVYQQQERHMAAGNEIQRSLETLAKKAESAERRAREAEFSPNLLLKNPRGVFVDWGPEGAERAFKLRIEWEVHNIGKGPAQEVLAAAAVSLKAEPPEEEFVGLDDLGNRPLMPGASALAGVALPRETSEAWAEFIRKSGFVFGRDLPQFALEKLEQYSGVRPAIVVKCRDVFGRPSRFAADLEGNMRLIGTPFGGES